LFTQGVGPTAWRRWQSDRSRELPSIRDRFFLGPHFSLGYLTPAAFEQQGELPQKNLAVFSSDERLAKCEF